MIKTYRTIVLTNSPLKVSFRFEDKFQVLPINIENKPQCPFAKHYPCYLEYSLDYKEDEEKDVLSRDCVKINKVKEIRNILSCLTNHRFFNYESNILGWGMPLPDKSLEEMSDEEREMLNINTESKWFIGGYIYRNLKEDLEINSFTDYPVKAKCYENRMHEYFVTDPIDDFQHEISFSNTICSALHFYYNLSEATRRKVNSCIYLACDAMDIAATKKTLSFLSYVSALEGLVNLEIDDNEIKFECHSCKTIKESPYTCQTCGRPIWGIKQKFVKFLSQFVAGSENSQKIYKDIYNLRSKMTHTGKLFQSDYELSFEENKVEIDNYDYLMRLKTLQMFRIALDSWLRYKDKKKK